ncbi:cytochrome c3 family protein [Thermosulfurimonas sp. F29]|uniref:cytochrome c3 family protein n=1 Tax=Thermosulfurimonas sp. F29 TaxID=2867247 RepID=UPI001C83BE51|nr:cytochrome c3 family protein [Thermosulfurimonas sp. F29]MBX6422057.1 hypothetical protein [Thermosulfurimonas sp. F29]
MRWVWLVLLGLLWVTPAPGAVNCFNGGCHRPGAFKGAVQHGPVKEARCERCHFPHVSRYAHLLRRPIPDLCYECHKDFRERMLRATWVHLPVKRGACGRCHQPHAGPKGLLASSGAELCFNCHRNLRKVSYRVTHAPFKRGQCLACHRAHFGKTRPLLRQEGAGVCYRCHEKERTVSLHGRYARSDMDCLLCHNPHGSDRPHLVRNFLHEPYGKKACGECHESGRSGVEMCLSCHRDRKSDFLKVHTHYMRSDRRPFCVNCHSPHASDNRILLRGSPDWLCIRCHREALVQKRESLHIHPAWGRCLDCHEGHGSRFAGMLKGDAIAVCVRCHKTQGKFTHPIGEKVKDPRTGQSLTCVTCHDPMGTPFKYELRLSGEASLCLECHKGY